MDTTADIAPQTFYLFGSLPMELQIEVWKMAFDAEDPQGRRKDIGEYYCYRNGARLLFKSPYSSKKAYFDQRETWRFKRVPAGVMRVCRVSRLVALQSWIKIVQNGNTSKWTSLPKRKELILRVFGGLLDDLKDKIEMN